MVIKTATGATAYATAPASGITVVNDYRWPIEVSANGDLIKIGELAAYHRILGAACGVFGLLDSLGKLVETGFDVYIPNDETDGATDDNTIFPGAGTVEDTETFTPFEEHLVAEKIGVAAVNRPIYLKITTAPTAPQGAVVVRMATFADQPY
ncbi:MAG: hypothetical protein LBL59_08745 [Xanthomonadaceae bacterium]|jgi:hypothetical protein|nr:hypothetical protein [Xanthomonadaceae bacterium]